MHLSYLGWLLAQALRTIVFSGLRLILTPSDKGPGYITWTPLV